MKNYFYLGIGIIITLIVCLFVGVWYIYESAGGK